MHEAQNKVAFTALYVKQENFEKYTPKNFGELVRSVGVKRAEK
ncbi:MAG: hypothetical protein OXB96_01945 [Candidatus Kaiserbacteria bacterium]|nr:hypothetical protein [Candidatus Kaiserbacteria bacterium]